MYPTHYKVMALQRNIELNDKSSFNSMYQDYSASLSGEPNAKTDKDWDGIIKVYTHLHASRDVRLKGVLSNMDTKISERLHGPLHKAYQMQTNFKNVEGQVSEFVYRSTFVWQSLT